MYFEHNLTIQNHTDEGEQDRNQWNQLVQGVDYIAVQRLCYCPALYPA